MKREKIRLSAITPVTAGVFMNRLSRYCMAGFLVLLVALPSWCQKSGSSGSGSGVGSPSSPTRPSVSGTPTPGLNQPYYQSPLVVKGRILMDTGQPAREPVSVALQCGIRPLQVIHSDLNGYFQFTLGPGSQNNVDFSANSAAPLSQGTSSQQSANSQASQFAGAHSRLMGCEVQVRVPGYQPLDRTITDVSDITGIDVGTLQLMRVAGVAGSSISVTSLQVPNNARKEFDKGDKDARDNHLDSATQHLEKAVAEYDKYAAAWCELGRLYASSQQTEKARQAFQKAIEADSHYISPYLGLAGLELQNQEFEPAVETAGKALELDPSIGVANFIQAFGNFKLNRLDTAEKSAQMAEKGPHTDLSDLHALHAAILLQKQDYPDAAAQMRAYLKEFPQGRFADEMKKDLQRIENSQDSADGQTASAQPIAP